VKWLSSRSNIESVGFSSFCSWRKSIGIDWRISSSSFVENGSICSISLSFNEENRSSVKVSFAADSVKEKKKRNRIREDRCFFLSVLFDEKEERKRKRKRKRSYPDLNINWSDIVWAKNWKEKKEREVLMEDNSSESNVLTARP